MSTPSRNPDELATEITNHKSHGCANGSECEGAARIGDQNRLERPLGDARLAEARHDPDEDVVVAVPAVAVQVDLRADILRQEHLALVATPQQLEQQLDST